MRARTLFRGRFGVKGGSGITVHNGITVLASERSERDTISGEQIRAGAIYICNEVRYIYVWRYVCHNSSACLAYVMWAELVHCHFLYVPAVLK